MPSENESREVSFLNKVYENAQMGEESISILKDKISNPGLMSDLQTQHKQYTDLSNKTVQELSNRNAVPQNKKPLSQVSVWSGIQLNTLTNKSTDHIAEMMIQGSMMGVIDMTRTLKQFSDIQPSAYNLGQELIGIEENNVQRMKQYLG